MLDNHWNPLVFLHFYTVKVVQSVKIYLYILGRNDRIFGLVLDYTDYCSYICQIELYAVKLRVFATYRPPTYGELSERALAPSKQRARRTNPLEPRQ